MKKLIRIVDSIEEYDTLLNERLKKGALDNENGIIMTPETFNKVFSPKRIKLLQRIHQNKIGSIYQLAKELGTPYEVVFRNIKYLEGIGLISVLDKDNKKVPRLTCEVSINMFPKAATSQSSA